MAHLSQQRFLCLVRSIYPYYFINKNIIDLGSANVCGSNRFLFKNCSYIGVDVWEGKNVDCISEAHKFDIEGDTVIMTEVSEHDMNYALSISNAVRLAKECFIFTCASTGRPKHGTSDTTPPGSPFKNITYYRNLTIEDIEPFVKGKFAYIEFFSGNKGQDLYVLCIKNEPKVTPNRLTFILLFIYRFFLNRLHDYAEFFKRITQRFSKQ